MSEVIEQYGWTAVPRNRSNVPSEEEAETESIGVSFDVTWPATEVVKRAEEYVKKVLPLRTLNHSMRVYNYGHTIVEQHFPSWLSADRTSFFETWALTCLFHDIGTTAENLASTHLSFEFQGGFIALQKLQAFGASKAQAESVCEAIIRHQDPGESGTVSRMVQLVQLATEFDNMGWQPHLIHKDVIEQVAAMYPRNGWSTCFAAAIRKEIAEKPWCHTTALEGFEEAVAGNKLMEPWE